MNRPPIDFSKVVRPSRKFVSAALRTATSITLCSAMLPMCAYADANEPADNASATAPIKAELQQPNDIEASQKQAETTSAPIEKQIEKTAPKTAPTTQETGAKTTGGNNTTEAENPSDKPISNEADLTTKSDATAQPKGNPAKSKQTVKKGLVKSGSAYRYYKTNGTYLKSRWKTISGRKYYFNSKGYAARHTVKIGKSIYYFDSNCRMKTGWVVFKNDKNRRAYFAKSNGKALKGWCTVKGKRYYFDPANKCRTALGIKKIEKSFYHFNRFGAMSKGWVTFKSAGKRGYYSKKNGKAFSGWHTIKKKRYYFVPSDKCMTAKETKKIGSKMYRFDKQGALVKTYTPNRQLKLSLSAMTNYQFNGNEYIKQYTKAQVKNALNPVGIPYSAFDSYQFVDLRKTGTMTEAQLNAFISSTDLGRSGKLNNQGAAFLAAAKKYSVNECYLLSHAILESGWGTSTLAKGYVYDGKTKINGKKYPKGTYYNFYGIGAYDDSPLSGGRSLAVQNGWTSPEKAIEGAAKWISSNYFTTPLGYIQPTLYAMKWDYERSNASKDYGWHQYATDPWWALAIAQLMGQCYNSTNAKPKLTYIKPGYKC